MLTLRESPQEKELSQSAIETIFKLLKINPAPDTADFLNNTGNFLNDEDEDKDFYRFFFDVLLENNFALDIDWKWGPDDIFWQLEKYFTTKRIKLINYHWEEEADSYRIMYQLGDRAHVLMLPYEQPNKLLDELSRQLDDHTFIAISFKEDRYSWLIVPKDFDVELFCDLTGLSIAPPPKPEKIPKNFAEGYKQTEKIFFRPTIIYVDENNAQFAMPGQVWAGRVLPGQTIREGIATELKEELNYTGRFNYSYDSLEGVFKDKEGRDIKRYKITVYLLDKTFQSKMAGGTDIRLKRLP